MVSQTPLAGEDDKRTWIKVLAREAHFPLSISVLGNLLSTLIVQDSHSDVSFTVFEEGEDFLVMSKITTTGVPFVKVGLYLSAASRGKRQSLLACALAPLLAETHILFSCVDHQLADPIKTFFAPFEEWQLERDATPYTKYAAPAPDNAPRPALGPVTHDELDLIISSNELTFPRTYLEPRLCRSRCVRDEKGGLKAWSLLHQDLGIGLVHTRAQFRGQGLGAQVVSAVAHGLNEELYALDIGNLPWLAHGDTSPKNLPMIAIFTKLGWRPVSTKLWINYRKV